MVQQAAGWYPISPQWEAWWSGTGWTDHRRPRITSARQQGADVTARPAASATAPRAPQAPVAPQAPAAPQYRPTPPRGAPPTQPTLPVTAYLSGGTEPALRFTSHIAGRNAEVEIWADRIQWRRPHGVSGVKVAAGVLTVGLSLIGTGVRRDRKGSEMLPMKAVTSVSSRRDGVRSIVDVATSSGVIGFRVHHDEAERIASLLNTLILR
ncbi:DUF2510 domain-containing protein [Microbacterium gorillae]|uniref:DUF2510 domain-containing protein n=1 Tax=Microbacterium gorillae TaxID=1231063 RepID=UPI00058D9D64|nr:DUF2510 domain-containing protein [Microbacterium gorillae]